MKAIAVILLFICAAGATRNLFGMQGTDLKELDNLFEDTKSVANPAGLGSTAVFGNFRKRSKYSPQQNDHHEGSGEGSGVTPPTEEPTNPAMELMNVFTATLPYLKQLKEEREEKSEEYAKEFVDALNNEDNDDKVKGLFGKHIRLLHERCNKALLAFAQAAHDSKLLEKFPHEEVDLQDILGKIIENADNGGGVMEHFFKAMKEHNIKDHPGVKALVALGGLVGDAACDLKLDGFMKAIGKVAMENGGQQSDEDEVKRGRKRFLFVIWKVCQGIKKHTNLTKDQGPLQRAVSLIFDEGCSLKEVSTVRDILQIIQIASLLGKKVGALTNEDNERRNEVIALYDEEDIEKADQELGKYTLSLLRRSTLVRILLYLQQQRPPPRGRPRGDEKGASLMEDEAIAYLQRMQ